jgi:RNA polymerase sigma-70 factor (ECF subfamily)
MVAAFTDAVDVEELYRVHRRRVRWIVWRIVGNRQDADDITQSAFERLIEAGGDYGAVRNEGAFVTTIATNLARNHLRRCQTVRRHSAAVAHHYGDVVAPFASPAESAAEEAGETARRQALEAGIAGLPPKCRIAFVLCKLKGLTYQQAAERMGISIHMIKKHVQRGMAQLSEHLDTATDGNGDTMRTANDVG